MTVMEMGAHSLDLSRPELAQLMERYVPSGPSPVGTATAPPSVLIVEGREWPDLALREAFEDDGWAVKTCPGPGATACPILRGGHCELRASVDAAVVFVEVHDTQSSTGSIPRLRCAADSTSPGVVALTGRLDAARFGAKSAVVGALRGPDAILHTVSALTASQR